MQVNHCYFLNLCDNLLYYMICFFLLSLVFVSLLLFISLSLSCLLISDPHLVLLPILWIYYALLAKKFPNFTIFFLSLVPIIAQLLVNKQLNIFSLSYLYNIRERVTNTEWQRVTKPKKKKNHRHRFNSQSPTSVHHYQ